MIRIISRLRKIFLAGICLFFSTLSSGQCRDSIFNEHLITSDLVEVHLTTRTPLVGDDSSVLYSRVGRPGTLIKKNKAGGTEWMKRIKYFTPQFFNHDGAITGIFDTDENYFGTGKSGGIAKISQSGEMLWAKDLEFDGKLHLPLGLHTLTRGIGDDIILYGRSSEKEIGIYIFDGEADSLKLQKRLRFHPPSGKNENLSDIRMVRLENSLVIAVVTYQAEAVPTLVKNTYLLFIKINYHSGAIEKVRYLQANDVAYTPMSELFTYTLKSPFSDEFNFKASSNGALVMAGRKLAIYDANNRLYGITLDSNLSIIKYKLFSLPDSTRYFSSQSTEAIPFINNEGSILYSVTRDTTSLFPNTPTTSGCYYFLTDNNLDVLSQRFLSNEDMGSLYHRVTSTGLLHDNKDVQLIFQSFGTITPTPASLINIPYSVAGLPCRGEEGQFLTIEDGSFSTITTPYIQQLAPVNVAILPAPVLGSEPTNIEVEQFCVQKSVCDEIEIVSEGVFCVVGDSAIIRLKKSNQCLYRTQWMVDNRYMEITGINDTMLRLRFLKPFSGYIKASMGNCTLADSIYVSVQAPLDKLSLGEEFTFCPDSQYVLRATSGYTDYLWQNKYQADSFLVTRPGTYSVTATDYCGRKYSASLVVSAFNSPFLPSAGGAICRYDTLYVPLSDQFTDYQWRVSDSVTRDGMTLAFFPEQTTLYTVSANAFPGCRVSATIKVVVNNCLRKIIFPNAFSPNNDGLNDVFRAATEGSIRYFDFKIYNRYGQLIFQSADPNKGWDGYYRGELQSSGSYVWTCAYAFRGADQNTATGTFLLVR